MTKTRPPLVDIQYLDPQMEFGFRNGFNRSSFAFRHSLQDHPLFDLASLVELDRRLPGQKYYDAGDVGTGDRWDQMPPRPLTTGQVLQQIHEAKAWMFIKNAQRAPEYGQVLETLMAQAERLVGNNFRRNIRNQEMLVFVTSPNRVTPYHIDRECSFLLQIKGTKTIYIFDRDDREVLGEEELERFWSVDNNAPRYREHLQAKATAYTLEPGMGVHIPVNFPHWLKNDDNVSISVNINVQFPERVRGDIYRANHILRRLGMKPNPPGHRSDIAKALFAGTLRATKKGLQWVRAS